MALNLAPFGRWTLRDKAAQRRLALRWATNLQIVLAIFSWALPLSLFGANQGSATFKIQALHPEDLNGHGPCSFALYSKNSKHSLSSSQTIFFHDYSGDNAVIRINDNLYHLKLLAKTTFQRHSNKTSTGIWTKFIWGSKFLTVEILSSPPWDTNPDLNLESGFFDAQLTVMLGNSKKTIAVSGEDGC